MKNKSAIKAARPATVSFRHGAVMALRTCLLLGGIMPTWSLSAASAAAEDQSLKLYFAHTGEHAIITFKRDGVYDQNGLNQLNRFLRDWRRNETIKMDPLLFDIVWEMYRRSGAADYVNVVSGYRSPNTNAMLRSRSSGVAKESQHTRGKAIDFFIPGVKLATLRGLGMQMQGGGVGYYPTSGSPFVHIDVGRVRAWPRMSRQELVRLFPDGRTLHIPTDGRPLPGYNSAIAEYKRRGSASVFEVASVAGSAEKKKGGLLSSLFKGDDTDEDDDVVESRLSAGRAKAQPGERASSPTLAVVEQGSEIVAPIPAARPGDEALLTSLWSSNAQRSHEGLQLIDPDVRVSQVPQDAFLAQIVPAQKIPIPTFAPRGAIGEQNEEIVTASIAPLHEQMRDFSSSEALPGTGAGALLVPPGGLDRVVGTFSVSYRAEDFSTTFFKRSTAVASFDAHRFGNDPCPSMTASTSVQAAVDPC
ncbi:DUF882 domain-containing protein [Rhizobium leguminosarum]|uniref:DUF882 domain-containing protein n=1 Tax=Rhizobium leguminosarum TaxID=384 RepID=UPI0036D94737